MIRINPETGYFMGRSFFEDGRFQSEGCLPAAMGNYLLVKGFSQETAQDAVYSIQMDHRAGQGIHLIPMVVKGAIHDSLDLLLEVDLYYKFPQEDIPAAYRESVKSVEVEKIVVPAIILTKLEEYLTHMWVMTQKEPLEGIDVNGEASIVDYSIDGYLEIRGLEDVLKK